MYSVTLEKIRKVSNTDQSGDSKKTGNACHRRAQRRRTGHSKRPGSWSSGVQTPLLRKSLVTFLRTVSEAIYQNIVLLQNQQLPFSLSWEKYAVLTQLREHLCTHVQTVYVMATQAAYVFPTEGWLVPAPLPGAWGTAGDEGDAQSPF